VDDVVFLGYPDGEVEPTLTLRRDLAREIRRFRPDTVICFDPTVLFAGGGYINHPDHRAVGLPGADTSTTPTTVPWGRRRSTPSRQRSPCRWSLPSCAR